MTAPLLTGRHPVVIVELLLIVFVVRSVALPPSRTAGWGWLVRLGMIAVPLGVIFNMFTVHAGNRELFRVPGNVPLIGGSITWNAVVYGLLSGLTIVALVAAGTTVAAAIDWSELMRLVPSRAANIAVAGSVAWAFLPQLSVSWREIREAQAARGHRWRGVRDVVPLVVPLMAGGLDRSISMAEALESRGFGVSMSGRRSSPLQAVAIGGALTAGTIGLYLFAVGQSLPAAVVVGGAALLGLAGMKGGSGSTAHKTTHYRTTRWSWADWIVATGAVASLVAVAATLQLQPAALRYEPYPSMDWPVTSPWLALALALLMLPAVIASASPGEAAP